MRQRLRQSEVRTRAATQLLETLNRYVYSMPVDANEAALFKDIPLAEYALSAHVPTSSTALHKVLLALAYNDWYVMFYDDLDFSPDLLPEIRKVLSFTFSEMRMVMPQEFETGSPDDFRAARDKYRQVFSDGLQQIVEDTFAIAWSLRPLLADFNQILATRIREMKLTDDSRLEADGRLPRLNHLPAWLRTAIHGREAGFCQKCGLPAVPSMGSHEAPHIDHIVPLANGGGNDPTNLRLLCAGCNLTKGASNEHVGAHFVWPDLRRT